jgi:biopolymer transport protein ExbB
MRRFAFRVVREAPVESLVPDASRKPTSSATGTDTMTCSGAIAKPHWIRWVGICLLAVFLLVVVAPSFSPVHAQEPGADAGKKKGGSNIVSHMLKAIVYDADGNLNFFGILVGLILAALSLGMVTLIILLALDLRMGATIPPGFVEDFTETVNQRKFKEAYEMSREDGSFLGRVLTTGMSRLQYGIEDAREASVNMVESIKAGKEQLISYLATIGTLGPLLGLVGTVYGMIGAFKELGKEGETPKPQKLADNLSHALAVTMLGIGLSVPAVFAHTFFRNRLIRMSMDTNNIADDLLTQMYHNSKKAGPAGPTAPAPSAPQADRAPSSPQVVKK